MKKPILIPLIILLAGCGAPDKPLSKADSALIKENTAAIAKADSIANLPPLPNDVQAEYMAHLVVKTQLLDPASAEFEGEGSKMATYADTSFVFNGIVLSLNKLGIKAPVEYNVGIKYKGGNPVIDSSWTVKFCNIK